MIHLQDHTNGLTSITFEGDTITLNDEQFVELTSAMVALTARRARAKLLAEIEAKKPSPESA